MSGILLDDEGTEQLIVAAPVDEVFVGSNPAEVRRRRRWVRYVSLAVASIVVAGASGTAYATYRSERARSDLILPGVVVQGVVVGGLTREQAMAAVSAAMQPLLDRPITLQAGRQRWTIQARLLGLRADVASAVEEAVAYSESHSTIARLLDRVRRRTYERAIGVRFWLAEGAITPYVRDVARAMARTPTDAQLGLRGLQLVKVRSRPGAALQAAEAETMVAQALLEGSTRGGALRVRLPVRSIPAKLSERQLGRTIAVNLSENRLYLYDGLRVIRTYMVATAKPGFLTPPGEWTILDKKEFPTWYNPAPTTWGANEPLIVPPGPDNPMGTRAFYLDAPGLIRIHGTNDPPSIGHYASHGCIRLHIPDVEALYDLVPVGTRVLIYGEPPWGVPSSYGTSGA
jgi:lipoprotein-anchoring transpeptidase ErfK/SrfK